MIADINECKTGEHLCDTDISECENAKGYYKCVCKSGYEHKCTGKYTTEHFKIIANWS